MGELSVAPDGAVDGFCLDPARPGLRCWVQIMVEGEPAATVLARDPRDDLAARGHPDGAHGFHALLPPATLPPRPELLVWARVRGARCGFAQRLLVRPGLVDPMPDRERRLAAQVAELSDRLEALCRPGPATPEAVWQERIRALAGLLARRGGRATSSPGLPFMRYPAVTLALPLLAGLADAVDRVARLVPLARELAAEVLALNLSRDADLALLPALVPNLRLVEATGGLRRAVAEHARGERIVLLDPAEPELTPGLADALRRGRMLPA